MNEGISVVTGAAGRIGFPLCLELKKRGKYVRAFCHSASKISKKLSGIADEVVLGDLLDIESLTSAFAGAEYVYHLGGVISIRANPGPGLDRTNITGTKNVIEACKLCGVKRLIYTSSVHAIDFTNTTDALREPSRYYPERVEGGYAKAKAAAANLVLDAVNLNGLDAVIAMPSGVVGAYEYKLSNFGQMVKDVSRGKLPAIIKGEYDFVDTVDVAWGMAELSEKGVKGESYLLSGHKTNIRELVDLTAKHAGVKPPRMVMPAGFAKPVSYFLEWWYADVLKKMPLFTPYSIQVLHDNCNFPHDKMTELTGYNPRSISEALRSQVDFNFAVEKGEQTYKLPAAVYYFSATGNSLWTARAAANALPGAQLFNIAEEYRKESIEINAEKVIFVFPAYAYEMPRMVRRFIKKAEINAFHITALVTCGSVQGGALAEMKRLLKRKKQRLDLARAIPAVENYIPIFGEQPPEKQKRRTEMQRLATARAIKEIAAGERNYVSAFKPHCSFVSVIFRMALGLMRLFYKVNDKCTGCGMCEKVCPAGAIELNDKSRPKFKSGCEQCQACMNWCPVRAINYARLKPSVPRYHHPKVTASDLCVNKPAQVASAGWQEEAAV